MIQIDGKGPLWASTRRWCITEAKGAGPCVDKTGGLFQANWGRGNKTSVRVTVDPSDQKQKRCSRQQLFGKCQLQRGVPVLRGARGGGMNAGKKIKGFLLTVRDEAVVMNNGGTKNCSKPGGEQIEAGEEVNQTTLQGSDEGCRKR